MDLSIALLASAFLGSAVVLANVGLRYLDPAMRRHAGSRLWPPRARRGPTGAREQPHPGRKPNPR